MRPHLLYADRDPDTSRPLPAREPDLARDLELGVLLRAMARGDQYLQGAARTVLHDSLVSPDQIRYRQDIVADSVRHPAAVRAVYQLATAATAEEHAIPADTQASPTYRLHRGLQVLEIFAEALRQLRAVADEYAGEVRSAGLRNLFVLLRAELDDAYLTLMGRHLRQLTFPNGLLMSASLGPVGKGAGYVLRRFDDAPGRLRGLLPGADRRPGHVLVVPDRDVTARQTLSGLRDQGTRAVADAVVRSCEHVGGFLEALRRECGFYLGCLNLHEQLVERACRVCMPDPLPAGRLALTARGLRDAALALTLDRPVVGNDLDADDRALLMITGANQGGKSTFLRSVGLAQLMMQCGLFVTADSLAASVCGGIYTHWRRPEDTAMASGKLDEELARMSVIVDAITPDCLLLCNESFAATNEREGSHIAATVTGAMLDAGVRVAFVTHFHQLAANLYSSRRDDAVFLRADRQPDGSRTFRLAEGAPRPTGDAADLYEQVFGDPLGLAGPRLPATTP